MVLTFESVDEILWCDYSNETSSAILSHGTIYLVLVKNVVTSYRHSNLGCEALPIFFCQVLFSGTIQASQRSVHFSSIPRCTKQSNLSNESII